MANNMASIKHELGIKATYFILTTCEYHNILSKNSRRLLKEILGIGHEIALHFDPTLYNEANMNEQLQNLKG